MTELPELKKLADIATDLELTSRLRLDAIDQLGNIGTHESLLALLGLAANEKLEVKERDAALKQARKIVRSSH
jgi:hypothetical protein